MDIQDGKLIKCSLESSTIIVPEGVKVIGKYVFLESTVSHIQLPSTLETIEEGAFANSGVETIELPASLKKLQSDAFIECKNLKAINIPRKVRQIPSRCFANCTSLKEVKMHPAINKIGRMAFAHCPMLEKCDFPVDAQIGDAAFLGCTSLFIEQGPYTIRKDGKVIERYLDEESEECRIPEGVERIGSCILKSAKKLYLPSSLRIIDPFTLMDCNALEELDLPEGLKELGEDALPKNGQLRKLRIPKSLEKMDASSLPGTLEALEIADGNKLFQTDGKYVYSCDRKKILRPVRDEETYEIPEGVEEIQGFVHLQNIRKISIPGSVKVIHERTFADYFCPVNAMIFNQGVKEIQSKASGSLELKELHIPDTLEIVGKNALPCSSIELLVIEHWTPAIETITKKAKINKIIAVFPDSVPKKKCSQVEPAAEYIDTFLVED